MPCNRHKPGQGDETWKEYAERLEDGLQCDACHKFDDWVTNLPVYIPKKYRPYIVGEYKLQTSVPVPAQVGNDPGKAILKFEIPTDAVIYHWQWVGFDPVQTSVLSGCFLLDLLQSQRVNWLVTTGDTTPLNITSSPILEPDQFQNQLFGSLVTKTLPFIGNCVNNTPTPGTVQVKMYLLEMNT